MKAELIDWMGDDLRVANAARVSFAKWKEEFDERDVSLVKYLAMHSHWTPFAHTAITLRMAAPVPVRTQCFKHKVGFVENEESRRYISTRPELFIPDSFRSRPDGSIKQGSGGVHPRSAWWLMRYETGAKLMIDVYEEMIADGIAPEQARFILPQGVEVMWIWTGSLYAYANYYRKRIKGDAQGESRDLATAVGKIIEPLFPHSWRLLTTEEEK